MTSTWYRIKADSARRHLFGGSDPLHLQLCRVLAEGRGPGPRNVLVELADGQRFVLIRRDKSLFKRPEPERQPPQQGELF